MRYLVTIILTAVLSFSYAAGFKKMASGHPELVQSGPEKLWCSVCGMNLKMFYKTSHAVKLKDGTAKQYCSIRCLAADWPNIKDKVKEILVVDAKTEKLVPAKKAYYVIGSKVPGTMSMVSKIAFKSKKDAEEFAKRYGGKIVDFETSFKTAFESLEKDSAMLAKKKKMMMYPKGEKIYKKMCKKEIKREDFKNIGELKAYLVSSKVCGDIKGRKLQALALYIWEAKDLRVSGKKKNPACKCSPCKCNPCKCGMNPKASSKPAAGNIKIPKNAKCPVCGMYVYKFPRWAAKVVLDNGKVLYFDGAKDMFKFIRNPAKWGYKNAKIKAMSVTDYYKQVPINAKKAYFVMGSDVYGPMGNELIPFSTLNEAKVFKKDHRGKKILSFDEITEETVEKLDE
ncbi:nitrous oxide reductase accessory protein NosL [Nitrosophilus alvini]|uniref:nitrous oxide reductase accessory protein NosL n=1 Tax=Nitrosophilus alvini TaxID=2714855 RepID=UPI00190C3879|nr:nitrous oxide reductase accessory protein NosL [Nitrosophilus alvini]